MTWYTGWDGVEYFSEERNRAVNATGYDKHAVSEGEWSFTPGCTCKDCSIHRDRELIIEELRGILSATEIATTPKHRMEIYSALPGVMELVAHWVFWDFGGDGAENRPPSK